MPRAVLFDLYETLVTESQTRPSGVSSLTPQLGCEREAFRRRWKAVRPEVVVGRVSFRQAIGEIAAALGTRVDAATLQRLCDDRVRVKAQAFANIDQQILLMLDQLRDRGLRLGVISNCFAEDVAAWPQSALASRVDCTVFSFEVGLAKPDSAIYIEAARRLGVDASEIWFVGDGADDEIMGAARAGLRAFQAPWFLERWPHFQADREPGHVASASLRKIEDLVRLLDRSATTSE